MLKALCLAGLLSISDWAGEPDTGEFNPPLKSTEKDWVKAGPVRPRWERWQLGEKGLASKDAALKDGKVREADKQKEEGLKGPRVKNNGSWSVCSSLEDKNRSVCGGQHPLCVPALAEFPSMIRA